MIWFFLKSEFRVGMDMYLRGVEIIKFGIFMDFK